MTYMHKMILPFPSSTDVGLLLGTNSFPPICEMNYASLEPRVIESLTLEPVVIDKGLDECIQGYIDTVIAI